MADYIDRSHDPLSPEQIDMLDNARGDSWLDAYYFGFEATGVKEVDRILAAIARAGKAYHSTESWDEPSDWRNADSPSFIELIQSAANSAAASFQTPENVECPTCGGECNDTPSWYCPDCSGTGRTPENVEEPT